MGTTRRTWLVLGLVVTAAIGCGSDDDDGFAMKGADAGLAPSGAGLDGGAAPGFADWKPLNPRYEDVFGYYRGTNVATEIAAAHPGVFVPPFRVCMDPKPGHAAGAGPNGQVCTTMMITGATEAGRKFTDYGSCDMIKTNRPAFPVPAAKKPDPADPRLQDAAYVAEVEWVRKEVSATACVCCHASSLMNGMPSMWDVEASGLWTDTMTDSAVLFMGGEVDGSALGTFHPMQNNGFSRDETGQQTTDPERMRRFFVTERKRRGVTDEKVAMYPPFGTLILMFRDMPAQDCAAGLGFDGEGNLRFSGDGRYVYVLPETSPNPSVPPDKDLPAGTLWRLDVHLSKPPLKDKIKYGATPPGTFQHTPAQGAAPPLEKGKRYHVYVMSNPGIPAMNCISTY